MNNQSFSSIDINNIDLDDLFYTFKDNHSKTLIDNFFPEIYEPILIISKNDCYKIIDGFKRLYSLIDKNINTVRCLMLPPDNDVNHFIIGIKSNLKSRKLNIVEISNIAYKLNTTFTLDLQDIIRSYSYLIKEFKSEKVLNNYLKIYSMPSETKNYLQNNNIQLSGAVKLLHFNLEELNTLTHFLNLFMMGTNKMKDFVNNLLIIKKRNNQDINTFLKQENLYSNLFDNRIDKNILKNNILEKINCKAYPEKTLAFSNFNKIISNIEMKKNMTIKPSINFESDIFKLEISFRNIEDFQHIQNTLSKIDSKDIEKLFNL